MKSLNRQFWISPFVIVLWFAASLPAAQPGSSAQNIPKKALQLQAKAEAIVAELQKQANDGILRDDIIKKMQNLDPLMKAGKLEEAEQLLDASLKDLGITFKAATTDSKPSGKLPAIDLTGFHSIFDGKSLNNWDGDSTYWSVRDGVLLGTITPETLLKKNSWILYRGEQVKDFELVLDYRVSSQGNSGIGYRLAVLEDDPFSVRGPQADIQGADMFTGICYEENGRRLLAARGQSTRIDPNQLPRLVAQLADPEELQSVVRKEDWNRYRLVVRGNDAQHFINGVLMSEVHDHDEPNRMHQGLLGVQVHVGPPMTIEYREMYLKHLGPKPKESASRESVTYRSGTLKEPEHAETFNHLADSAKRMTAPRSEKPAGGKKQLEITTRELGIVRSDLTNVKLSGGSKPLPEEPAGFDLIVMQGDQTIRVPGAGRQLIGKPLDRAYRVHLEWDEAANQYQLKNFSEAK